MQFGHFTDRGLPNFNFRCPSWNPMPDGKKNVIVLGCSHTYGTGLNDNEHWVAHLSKHKQDKLRYWNIGMPGASSDQIVRLLYGVEKLLDPKIIIVCWPEWSRRERLDQTTTSLTSDDKLLGHETENTDKQNFLKNVFFVEKFAEKNNCTTFHCFAQTNYSQYISKLNVLDTYTLANCWPYWDKFEQRTPYDKPSYAQDGVHYGVEHHERFAKLFVEYFKNKLR